MIEQLVAKDGKIYKKTSKIVGKRPATFWLLFLKNYALVEQPTKYFTKGCLVFLVPLGFLIAAGIQVIITRDDPETLFMLGVMSFFISLFIYLFNTISGKQNFIHSPTFHHLARFIIHIKGDVPKEMMAIRMDNTIIEATANAIDAKTLGIKKRIKTTYKAYQMERYALKFQLKDGSKCLASLHQITVRVRNTRRRSSGKVKSKTKFKHKLFYQLILTLPKSTYKVGDVLAISESQMLYSLSVSEDAEMYYLKIKFKQKPSTILKKIVKGAQDEHSFFTRMLKFAKVNKAFEPIDNHQQPLDNEVRF